MTIKSIDQAVPTVEEELHQCFQEAGISKRAFTWLGLLVCLFAWPCNYRLEWKNPQNLYVYVGRGCLEQRAWLEAAISKIAKDRPFTITVVWKRTEHTWIGYGPDW